MSSPPHLHQEGSLVQLAAPELGKAGQGHFDVQLDAHLHRQPLLLLGGDEGAEQPRVVPEAGAAEAVQGGHAVQSPGFPQQERCFLRVDVFLRGKQKERNEVKWKE